MFWSPCSIITIIFPFTSAPVNDDDVWELHTWESDVFMWRAAQDWVLKSVRFHGMHTCPLSRKQHRNTGTDKREKVLIAREFLESLAKLPSHYCWKDSQKLYLETVITSHTHLNKVFQSTAIPKENSACRDKFYSRKWRCKTLPYTNQKKISAMCVLDINTALSPNRTSGSMKREKKSQDRKRRMTKGRKRRLIKGRLKEMITSWFSPWTFRWSCWLHMYLQITTKPSFVVMTLQSTTCLTVMSCVTSGMRWMVNWRAATLHHAFRII